MSAFKPIVRNRKRWKPDPSQMDLHYRTATHQYSEGPREIVSVRLGKGLIKKLGWVAGDRVALMQDEENPLTLQMVKDDHYGYVIYPATYQENQTYESLKGQPCRMYFSGTIFENDTVPRTSGTTLNVTDWEVKDNGLLFHLPRDSRDLQQWLTQNED